MDAQLFKAVETLREMLSDRGYAHDDLNDINIKEVLAAVTPTEIRIDPDLSVMFCIAKDSVKEAKIMIQEHIKNLEEGLSDIPPLTFLLILQEKMSSNMAAILDECDKTLTKFGGAVQTFYMKELQFNPSKHILVPKHEKISEDAAKDLIDQYQLKNRFQLPLILKNDIMARYLGLRHGDIVKITRVTPTSGTYTNYRACM